MKDYPMCPECRTADIEVEMARDVRDPCPHCGGVLVESLRVCCVPDCGKALPVTKPLPVCHDCGVKIAVAHLADAERLESVTAERIRTAEDRKRAATRARDAAVCVYYVRLDEERIKIGYTSDLKARMASLRLPPDRLLAWEPGGRDVEKFRHAQFRSERIHPGREDFTPSRRLEDWIEGTRNRHGLPRWATMPDTKRVTTRHAS